MSDNMKTAMGLLGINHCVHCGMHHSTTCSRIRAIEYDQYGSIKRVEFHEPQPVVAKVGDMSVSAGASYFVNEDGSRK